MQRQKRRFLSFLVLLFVAAAGFAGPESKPKPLEIGATAPSFELPGVDGNTYTLKDFSDAKLLMVVFTCNHCPTAQAYENRIKKLTSEYEEKGVAVVAISPNDPKALRPDELRYSDLNDSFEEMKIRAKKEEFNFPYLYDGKDQEVSKKYGPVATPHVFLFDEERKLRYQGAIDDNENPEKVEKKYARQAIEALLKGEEVPKKTSRVFGCSVKWAFKRKQARKAKKKLKNEKAELKTLKLDRLRDIVQNGNGNVRMFNIWATWCGPCKEEFPDLVNIHNIYRSRDFKLYTISIDTMNQRKQALSFLNEHSASMTNFIVPSEKRGKMAKILDPKWKGPVPHTVIYGPKGNVLYRHSGRIDPLTVKRKIVNELGRTYFE